jgi:hypothetical protein
MTIPDCVSELCTCFAVGDTENRPKSDILGQASLEIRTAPCLDFPV